MKNLIIFLVLILSTSIVAFAGIELDFKSAKVKQGSLEPAVLKIDQQSAQNLNLNKLSGQTLGEVIYLYSVSPLMKKAGDAGFEAEATAVFIKVPESNKIVHKTGTTEIDVSWNGIQIIPTEAPKELLFGTFEIPSPMKLISWGSGLIVLIMAALAGWKFRQKLLLNKAIKNKKAQIKDEIISAKEFSDVVKLWEKKKILISEFPHIEGSFKDLEKVLFKYQFKPRQSETEKIEVMTAYREFIKSIEGGFNGI